MKIHLKKSLSYFCILFLVHSIFSLPVRADSDLFEVNSAVVAAAKAGDIKQLNQLKAHGNQVNSERQSALWVAVASNQLEAIEWLLQHGADIDFVAPGFRAIDPTPFLYAGAHGQTDVLKILIRYNPNTKLINYYGGNALIPAAEKGHVDTVRFLLEHTDVEVDLVNHLGWTALLEAVVLSRPSAKQTEIVRLLVEHGANIEIKDRNGKTALDHAVKNNLTELMTLLQR